MSVLIKGMEMPKSCDVCCFDLFVESCPLYNATPEELVGITWIKKARHRYCPLVEIPPHGKLIDADALYGTIEASKDGTIGHTTFKDTVLLNIRGMPTIIEAEENEDD